MSTATEVSTAFATYLRDIVPARQMVEGRVGEGPAPSVPSIIWRLDSYEPDEFPRVEYVDNDQIVHSVTPMSYRVTVLGGAAMDDAYRIVAGLRFSQRTGDLFKHCGLWGAERVQDLTALETGTMRQRAEVLIVLSADLTHAAPREWMDQVDLTVKEPAKQFDVTITVQGPN